MSAFTPVDPGYSKAHTALLFVDPYNDVLAEGGKLWPLVEVVARSVSLHQHLKAISDAVRNAGFYRAASQS